ncbi:hypothetical protein X975_06640, partial [Stegodyphus mimosarum]
MAVAMISRDVMFYVFIFTARSIWRRLTPFILTSLEVSNLNVGSYNIRPNSYNLSELAKTKVAWTRRPRIRSALQPPPKKKPQLKYDLTSFIFWNHIQNELIHLMGEAVLKKIIADAQVAKYYSIMLDYTPDAGHQEQMAMIMRIVDAYATTVEMCQHFAGFLAVDSSTGLTLTESCLKKFVELNLQIQNCRGQG